MKPDLVIAAISGYSWEQIRPFALSLSQSGFTGEKVILANNLSPFVTDCLQSRDFTVVPFSNPPNSPSFVIKDRFIPLLRFLEKYRHEYRYVIWVDAGDQIFQKNPSNWLEENLNTPYTIVAARECWRIKDEDQFNDPWVKAATPEAYDWLREYEVLCGGTVAGGVDAVREALTKVYEMVCAKPIWGSDQAFLNYVLRTQCNYFVHVSPMSAGWTATCSAFKTQNFSSPIGCEAAELTDAVPIFDLDSGLVLTPDGRTPFVLVHQYNRDARWTDIMQRRYSDF